MCVKVRFDSKVCFYCNTIKLDTVDEQLLRQNKNQL